MSGDDALWKEYGRTKRPEAREALITRYIPLARYVVERLNAPDHGCVTRDDLISHAIMGLIDALERFDPSRGVKFETYAVPRIRGSVADMLRRMDWVPRTVRRMETSVRAAYARLEAVLGRPATDEEIADELGLTLEAFQDVLADLSQTAVFSLDEALQAGFGQSADTLVSLVEDENGPCPSAVAEAEERTRILADAIGRLPERERLIIGLYYYEELTLKEIGRVLDVTEARVSQLHTRAILRLNGILQRMQPVLCG